MTARLRELAGDWIAAADAHSEQGFPAAADVGRRCADELLSILDAEGDGGAVGEKVCVDAVGRVERDMTGDLGINWVLEGGIHALEEGTWLLCADREITDDEGYGELYIRPARPGGVSDEDVEAACRAYIAADRFLLDGAVDSMREPMRAALTHFAEGAEVGGDVEDAEDAARYRWLRDNCQPGANSNDKPHALVKVCVGTVDNRIGWFSLIGGKAHVGIVTLDQAIDAAREGERYE